jgi:sugar-phosphatase
VTVAPSALAGRRFAAVLFDMDGTLVDSTPAVVRSWLRWAEEEGIDPRRLDGSHGRPSAQIVAALVPPERLVHSLARIDALELADTEGVVLLPGAAASLAALPAGRQAIATSCTRPLAAARIAAAGVRAPAVVVTADDVEHGKPDPAPYLLAARRLGVDAADCLVVEDAPSGLVSARAAGCATLAVSTTHEAGELDADVVVGTLADVSWDADGARAGVGFSLGSAP